MKQRLLMILFAPTALCVLIACTSAPPRDWESDKDSADRYRANQPAGVDQPNAKATSIAKRNWYLGLDSHRQEIFLRSRASLLAAERSPSEADEDASSATPEDASDYIVGSGLPRSARGRRAAFTVLMMNLATEKSETQELIVRWLAAQLDPVTSNRLIEHEVGQRTKLKLDCLQWLAEFRGEEVPPSLLSALSNPDWRVRSKAAILLRERELLLNVGQLQSIIENLQSDDAEIRLLTAELLLSIYADLSPRTQDWIPPASRPSLYAYVSETSRIRLASQWSQWANERFLGLRDEERRRRS